MSELFLLTNAAEPPPEVLPALGLLLHSVRTGPADVMAAEDAAGADAILVDARRDLIPARRLCQQLRRAAPEAAVLAIMTEGGLAAVTADWGTDDVVLHTAGPAEVEARLRLLIGRQAVAAPEAPEEISSGDLSIDEATYTARLRARVLDLTFKEFELLKFLAQHPGRVFTRAQLLQEVWGYDYFGGTRTVDVHVRRLRAKLGPEHEALIGTVRNVGYRFVPLKPSDDARRGHPPRAASPGPPTDRAPSHAAASTGTAFAGPPTDGAPPEGSPTEDRPSAGSPTGDRPSAGSPTGDRPSAGAPTGDRPSAGAPTGDSPSAGVPTDGRPSAGVPTDGAPSADGPARDRGVGQFRVPTAPRGG